MRRGLILLAVVLAMAAGIALAQSGAYVSKVAPDGGSGGTFQKEYTSLSDIPPKWSIWEESFGAFTLQRYFQGVAETVPWEIPANGSVTIKTPAFEDSSGTFIVKIAVAANTDSVCFMPVWD